MTTEVRVVIGAGVVESSHVTIPSATLAMSLGIVCVEIVTTRKCPIAAGDPTNMGLLLGVAFHMSLQMFLSLKTTLATRFFASKLDLLYDGWKVLEFETLFRQGLFESFP